MPSDAFNPHETAEIHSIIDTIFSDPRRKAQLKTSLFKPSSPSPSK